MSVCLVGEAPSVRSSDDCPRRGTQKTHQQFCHTTYKNDVGCPGVTLRHTFRFPGKFKDITTPHLGNGGYYEGFPMPGKMISKSQPPGTGDGEEGRQARDS